jgi:hypothetical protein
LTEAPIILGELRERDLVFLSPIGRFHNLSSSGQILIRTGEPIYSLYFMTDGTFSLLPRTAVP